MNPLEQLIRYNMRADYDEKKIIVYYTERGKPVIGLLSEELRSLLIGGYSGMGKTSGLIFLICQIVMAGGRVICLDAHWNAPRDSLAKAIAPLAPWFALPIAHFDEEDVAPAIEQFRWFFKEYQRRKKSGKIDDVIYLVCDEWAELLGMLDDEQYKEVIHIVTTVAGGGRKFNCLLALANQVWNLDATGGHLIRKKVPNRISFYQERADMSMLLQTRDARTLSNLCTPSLNPGEAIIKRSQMLRVRYPFTGAKDCSTVAMNMYRVFGRQLQQAHSDDIQTHSEQNGHDEHLDTFRPHSGAEDAENDIFANNLNAEYELTHTARSTSLHTHSAIASPPPTTTLSTTLGQAPDTYKKEKSKAKISQEERQLIIAAGKRQLAETGNVIRTKIRDDLGYNNYAYERKIKPICDELGWHDKMNVTASLPAKDWQAIKEKYHFTCLKCKKQEPEIRLEPDRVLPGVKGGTYAIDNIQCLCSRCNKEKGTWTIDYREDLV